MTTEKLYYIYLLVIFISVLVGFAHYARFDVSTRIILGLLAATLISETITIILALNNITKAYDYGVYFAVSLFLIFNYFLYTIRVENKKKYSQTAGLCFAVIGLSYMLFYAYFKTFYSVIFIFKCCFVIVMALYALYKVLLDDSVISLRRYTPFWFWVFYLVLYSGTFFFWSYISILSREQRSMDVAEYIQIGINICIYSGIGLIFLFYPKRQLNGEQL